MQVPVCNPYELFEALAAKHIEGDASFSNKVHQRIIKISLFCLFKKSFGFSIKNFGYQKSFGFGTETICYQKKFQIQYRKFLVAKKVSDLVSKFFGGEKSFGIGIEKIWSGKTVLDFVSFRFGVSSHTALRK